MRLTVTVVIGPFGNKKTTSGLTGVLVGLAACGLTRAAAAVLEEAAVYSESPAALRT